MKRRLAVVALMLACMSATPAIARHQSPHPTAGYYQITKYCDGRVCGVEDVRQTARPRAVRYLRAVPTATAPRTAAAISRDCLTWDTRAALEAAEAHFGRPFELVSTCRPGAKIAGTSHDSEHAFGKAVDLKVPRGISKPAVVAWLFKHVTGVVMTYRNMSHVHFDTGLFHKLVRGADAYGGVRTLGGRRVRHAQR